MGSIQVDNGSKFISKALDLWAYENDVTLAGRRSPTVVLPEGPQHWRTNMKR